MQVAVRDLKKINLSRLLPRVLAGEAIEVVYHNKPVARIVGIPSEHTEASREPIGRDLLSWGGGKPQLAPPMELSALATPVSQMVLEDRG